MLCAKKQTKFAVNYYLKNVTEKEKNSKRTRWLISVRVPSPIGSCYISNRFPNIPCGCLSVRERKQQRSQAPRHLVFLKLASHVMRNTLLLKHKWDPCAVYHPIRSINGNLWDNKTKQNKRLVKYLERTKLAVKKKRLVGYINIS